MNNAMEIEQQQIKPTARKVQVEQQQSEDEDTLPQRQSRATRTQNQDEDEGTQKKETKKSVPAQKKPLTKKVSNI